METRINRVVIGKNPPEMKTGYSEYLTVTMDNGAFHQILVQPGANARDFSYLLEVLAKEIRNISKRDKRATFLKWNIEW